MDFDPWDVGFDHSFLVCKGCYRSTLFGMLSHPSHEHEDLTECLGSLHRCNVVHVRSLGRYRSVLFT